MGGEEEEVLRIAKRLDKMVAKKSVVSGGHRRRPRLPGPRRSPSGGPPSTTAAAAAAATASETLFGVSSFSKENPVRPRRCHGNARAASPGERAPPKTAVWPRLPAAI